MTDDINEILQKALDKEFDKDFATEEERIRNREIENYARLNIELTLEEFRRRELLKENPKGFIFDRSGYCCWICDHSAPEGNSWCDKYGIKCLTCQKAIDEKIIPDTVSTKKDSWYSKTELAMYFNIKGADLSKYIKQSILKNRIILNEKGKVHCQLFLIKDNKDVLPPKKYLKSRIVKEIRKGEEWFTTEEWFEFIDLKLFQKLLNKYKILWCLKETFAKPMEGGRFYWQKTGSIFCLKDSIVKDE